MAHLDITRFAATAVDLNLYSTPERLKCHLQFFWGEHSLSGKRVLDIGGGYGLLSLWTAVNGGQAVCLEPESEGSSSGMQARFQRASVALGLAAFQATQLNVTFQQYTAEGAFDIIILANSINHLNETAVTHLHESDDAAEEYRAYFRRMFELLVPGGVLIFTDCDRRNLFASVGLPSPFMPDIEWHKHQSPRVWSALLKDSGFRNVKLSWSSPNSLGRLGRVLLGNRLAAFLLFSHFRLEATRPSDN